MKFFFNIINHLSIKRKLMMLGMLTSTIAVLVTCSGFILFNIVEERHDMIDEMTLVGKILAEEISSALVYREKNVIDQSLAALFVRDSITQACVFDIEGKEFTRFIKSKSINCSDIPKLNKKYEFINSLNLNNHLIFATDIKFGGIKHGSIYTITSLDKIDDKIKRVLYNSAVLFIVIIGTSYVISRSLQKNISGPILQLANISYAVRSGDYDIRAKHFSYDEVGDLTKAFNNMLDVIQDAKLHLEQKVKKRTSDLEKAMKVKEEFLANMSHEIRTPIHGIMNYAEFLAHDWKIIEDEKRFDFIKKLYLNSDRLMSLINNLLDLSKLDAKKMDFYFVNNDIVELVEDAIDEVEPLYIEKNINIKFEYDKNEKYIVSCDKERILQVVRNLLSNAIKFTKEGVITVRINYSEFIEPGIVSVKGIMISILDQGIGIPEAELGYIFDKFNQSAHTRTGSGGTGLGLAICKDIIKEHKGWVWAKNNLPNAGATFSFILPTIHAKKKINYAKIS